VGPQGEAVVPAGGVPILSEEGILDLGELDPDVTVRADCNIELGGAGAPVEKVVVEAGFELMPTGKRPSHPFESFRIMSPRASQGPVPSIQRS
jgi:hypothetical protein